jgi:hypothetical protein
MKRQHKPAVARGDDDEMASLTLNSICDIRSSASRAGRLSE